MVKIYQLKKTGHLELYEDITLQVAEAIRSSDEGSVLLDNVLPMHINIVLNRAISYCFLSLLLKINKRQ